MGCHCLLGNKCYSQLILKTASALCIIVFCFAQMVFFFFFFSKIVVRFFPGGPVVKNTPANAGDTGSIPEPGRLHMLLSS